MSLNFDIQVRQWCLLIGKPCTDEIVAAVVRKIEKMMPADCDGELISQAIFDASIETVREEKARTNASELRRRLTRAELLQLAHDLCPDGFIETVIEELDESFAPGIVPHDLARLYDLIEDLVGNAAIEDSGQRQGNRIVYREVPHTIEAELRH